VSSVSAAGGGSTRRLIALVLAVIGVLFVILGIVYVSVKAGSLPAFLGHTKPANGHHVVRMAVSFVIGVACLVAAWFVSRGGKSSTSSGNSAPVGASSRE
jgi:hypothetical protein